MDSTCPSVGLGEIPHLLKRAESAMKPPGFFGQLMGREADYDSAVQLLQQCGQRYKLSRKFSEASSCYIKAGEAACLAKDAHTEASMYVEAGNCIRRYSLLESVGVFKRGISVMMQSGRLAAAAKVYKTLGEEFEAAGDRQAAADSYWQAAGLFEADEFSKSQHSSCLCKYAELLAWGVAVEQCDQKLQTDALRKAATIFDEEGFKASQNNLLQYGAKDLFLKAMILRLAIPRQDVGDIVDLKLAMSRYQERNAHFTNSREATFLKQLIDALDEKDSDMFASVVESYDSISRLDQWKVHFLLRAKSLLSPEGGFVHGAPCTVGDDGTVDLS